MKDFLLIQKQYYELLKKWNTNYKAEMKSDDRKWLNFLDEVEIFWRKNYNLHLIYFEKHFDSKECILLGGQVYLDIENNEHIAFGMLKKNCIILDPFLKLSRMYRISYQQGSVEQVRHSLISSLESLIYILENPKNNITIFPQFDLLNNDQQESRKLLETIFVKFLSSIFKEEFTLRSECIKKYNSIEVIESKISQGILEQIILNGVNDIGKTLSEKVRIFQKENLLLHLDNEIESFYIALMTKVYQVGDIFINAKTLEISPIYWSFTPFHYSMMLYEFFYGDSKEPLRSMMISYSLYNRLPFNLINTVDKESQKSLKVIDRVNLRIDKWLSGREFDTTILGEQINKEIDELIREFELQSIK